MQIILDWLSFTYSLQSDRDVLGVHNHIKTHFNTDLVKLEKSRLRGYSQCATILDGLGVVGWNYERLDQGAHVQLSGSALELFFRHQNGVDFIAFLSSLTSDPPSELLNDGNPFINFSRVDYAIDDTIGQIDLNHLVGLCDERDKNPESDAVRTRFRQYSVVRGGWDNPGLTLYLGSRQSETFIRIYDKALEQKQFNQHWIRLEVELKGEQANNLTYRLINEKSPKLVPEYIFTYVKFRSLRGNNGSNIKQ